MATEQSQAAMKYYEKNKDHIHKFSITIYDSKDPEIWPWLTSRDEGKGATIRRLIREEIKRNGWKQAGR